MLNEISEPSRTMPVSNAPEITTLDGSVKKLQSKRLASIVLRPTLIVSQVIDVKYSFRLSMAPWFQYSEMVIKILPFFGIAFFVFKVTFKEVSIPTISLIGARVAESIDPTRAPKVVGLDSPVCVVKRMG